MTGSSELPLGLEPIALIAAIDGAAALPQLEGPVGHFLFIQEDQVVAIELLESLRPGDGSEPRRAGEIEADRRPAIIDVDRRGP